MNNSCDFYFACGVFFTELVAYNPEMYMNYFNNIELCYLNALQLGENPNFEIVEGTGTYLAAFNLGAFYELINNVENSIKYYTYSNSYNYAPALYALNKVNI